MHKNINICNKLKKKTLNLNKRADISSVIKALCRMH